MADISEWSPVDESNNQPPPNGFPEYMATSGLNNGMRAVMGAVRRHYDQVIEGTLTLPYLPLAGGSLTGTLSATEYRLSGTLFAARSEANNWHVLYDADGFDPALVLGGAAAGYLNDYRAESHRFTSNNAAVTFATINAAGLSTPQTVSAAVLSAINVFASGNMAATGAITGGTITATSGVVADTVHANTTLSAGTSVAAPTITASGNISATNLSTTSSISAGTWINAPQYRLSGVPIDFGTLFSELRSLRERVRALEEAR